MRRGEWAGERVLRTVAPLAGEGACPYVFGVGANNPVGLRRRALRGWAFS